LLKNREICHDFMGTVYEQAFREKRMIIIDDLKEHENRKGIENEILEIGIRNLAVVPLFFEDQNVGILELGSPHPSELNTMLLRNLHEVFPIFAIAVKRSGEEINNKIQATIKEECTAIHPSVEWRFVEAASNKLEKEEEGDAGKMERIVFDDVYPLYAVSDIRNSSVERNKAIQSDLLEHLKIAGNVLSKTYSVQKIPLIDELNFRIGKYIKNTKDSLHSGDEVQILDFLKNEIEPVFDKVRGLDEKVAKEIDNYKNQMDPQLGILYKRRKAFEDSLTLINDTISSLIDNAENEAQDVFPHYFEKYRTDGIETNIYIGSSLTREGEFYQMHLKNMRLWQLQTLCEIARKVNNIKPDLKIPLDITQLILVHSSPLSITFRQDEKKFDVAGAYNIRYEIMKKRIDKALIKNSQERLTQIGKIAIIYTQPDELREYQKYIEYLQSRGYVKGEIETFELDDVQGVSGLKAMRVGVNITQTASKESEPQKVVDKVLS